MKRLFFLFFLLIFFAGCDFESKPAGVMGRSEMINVLTDIHIVDGYIASSREDTRKVSKEDLYQSVFAKNHTDSVQFKKSLQYYSRNSEKFQEMYQKIEANVTARQEAMLKKIEGESKK